MKAGLLSVRTFAIPLQIVHETVRFLQDIGAEGFEGFVLWSGKLIDGDRFQFCSALFPEQRAMLTASGLLVTVEGKALFDVNKAVHERREILAAQVHSHPTDAYHSQTDDTFPLVTLVGALSVVVPDFARHAPRDLERWAWYRLSARGKWQAATTNTDIEIV